ncbi:MAG: response regulator [Lachnospiraceae bacterium]
MYNVLIADDDILMREALSSIISKHQQFRIVHKVETGEEAVKLCRKGSVDIVFMDIQMPGVTGIEASTMIWQNNPDISIYIISVHGGRMLVRGHADAVKDVLEKPITYSKIKKILDNYKTEHEYFIHNQLEMLTTILKDKNFERFYYELGGIIEAVYNIAGEDTRQLIKLFSYIGQNLLDTRTFYDETVSISELFPLNEGLILEPKTSELWLFRIMDYLFQKNSISRYPVLENVFSYIEKHIKENITLNAIINNCAISQGYLSRIFREQFQISVMEYLHMKKIHLAKGYFYFTDSSIGEVAFQLGYSESSYFSKVFKKYEKKTVKGYKNSVIKKC